VASSGPDTATPITCDGVFCFDSVLHYFCPYSPRLFGRPLQVTVLPMRRDRCTVCLVCLSVTLVYCGHTVGWIKMPLGTEVGLGPGAIVLDGDPASPTEMDTAASPTFRPTLLWHGGPSQQLLSAELLLWFHTADQAGYPSVLWRTKILLIISCIGLRVIKPKTILSEI